MNGFNPYWLYPRNLGQTIASPAIVTTLLLMDKALIRQMFVIVEPVAILVAAIAFLSLIMILIRGRQIPQCYYCGAIKVRPSRPTGWMDLAATVILIRAYRCSGCQTRFHAMRLFSRSRGQLIS
ncbi:MAG TPA: hypothetical protein VK752_09220 [Bryobacteraceae bacterium]|jgi:hypothetical protein|nr:hypothetical protein [Bryobacteraceae bacterium]